ncbi:MAG: LamG-like jellyroll fold domain-containing protein, partial [Actinomycetota bacterium]
MDRTEAAARRYGGLVAYEWLLTGLGIAAVGASATLGAAAPFPAAGPLVLLCVLSAVASRYEAVADDDGLLSASMQSMVVATSLVTFADMSPLLGPLLVGMASAFWRIPRSRHERFTLLGNFGLCGFPAPGVVNDGNWHHAAITATPTNQALFLDGAQVATVAGSVNWLSMSSNQIGAGYTLRSSWPTSAVEDGWWYFDGTLDEVAVYANALTPARIAEHYAAAPRTTSTITAAVGAGTHKLRIDYQELAGSAALDVTAPAGAVFKPRYGLATSTVDPDGRTGRTEYDRPELGLATATVTDPNGLALRSTTTYEAQGTGWLRAKTATLPGGNTTRYDYYSYDTAGTAVNPCGANATAVNQGGALWKRTNPAPASGAAIVEEFVYDAAGRTVAS